MESFKERTHNVGMGRKNVNRKRKGNLKEKIYINNMHYVMHISKYLEVTAVISAG